MQHKIPRIDERVMEEWTRNHPRISRKDSLTPKKKVGMYGNYTLRDKIMELLSWIRDPYNVVVVPGQNHKYFKEKEKELITILTEMEAMI